MHKKDSILHVLPRLDCGQCGYKGCYPYAQAVEQGVSTIDRCTPGGLKVLEALADIMDKPVDMYIQDMHMRALAPQYASIQSDACVGCFKCVEVCPVDAIIGARGMLHSVLLGECNGCGLCVPACPVDCITLTQDQESDVIRYEHREYYAKRQADKKKRMESVHADKSQHAEALIGKGNIGRQRRKTYIEQAMMRIDIRRGKEHEHTTTSQDDT